MANEPFLSVVIPTYNRAAMLKRCIDSVLAAKSNDIEVLVSDNCSPDATQDTLRAYNDPRLRFWRNAQNLGAPGNILELWRQARGHWIFCLADDDFVLPAGLDETIEILKKHPNVGVFLSSLQAVDEKGTPIKVRHYSDKEGVFTEPIDSMPRLVWAYHVFSRITFRRELADFEGSARHAESQYPQIYLVIAILRKHPALYLKGPFVAHTWGNEQFWNYPLDQMLHDRVKIFEDALPGPEWKAVRTALKKQITRYLGSYEEQSRAWRAGKWKEQQALLLKEPTVRWSPRFWWRLVKFLFRPNKSGGRRQFG
jgi:glycosyltransferase involved in cell wall biosynthesis